MNAVIYGAKHGAADPQKELVEVSGPSVPLAKQREIWKEFARTKAHPELGYAEYWTSDSGRTKRLKLSKPAAQPKAKK